jgi:excisionase family DNA binding protein
MGNLLKVDRACSLNDPTAAAPNVRYAYEKTQAEQFQDPRAFGLVRAAYSVKETLELLSIGRTTFYELVDRAELKITKLGRKSLVYAVDIAALLNKLRAKQ